MIIGSAVNQDGRSSGLTAPNGPSQQALIKKALLEGSKSGKEISFIEAHGTGTSLGDPIEVQAICEVLGKNRSESEPLIMGSVKTNIGHSEAAAGIAGLIKVIVSLENQEIPKHLHFKELNPHISLDNLPVVIPTESVPWKFDLKRKRMAGISSFGFSGTNAHVIIEEGPYQSSIISEIGLEWILVLIIVPLGICMNMLIITNTTFLLFQQRLKIV